MATPALTELIALLGDAEGQRLYRAVQREVLDHFEEHLVAREAEPGLKPDAREVLERAKADPGRSLHLALHPNDRVP